MVIDPWEKNNKLERYPVAESPTRQRLIGWFQYSVSATYSAADGRWRGWQ